MIIALYFFNVWYAPEIVDLPYEIIGFNPAFLTIDNMDKTNSFGVFWKGLIWHIFILVLTSIQYHITNVKNVGNVNIETSIDRWELFTKEKNATLHAFVEKCKMIWDKIFLETELLYYLGTLLSYFAVFLLIFLQKEASWIGFLFLLIVMICFTLNVVSSSVNPSTNKMGYRLFKLFVASWYIFVFYSTFVFVVEYAYQFPSLYSYIQSILPEVERAQQFIQEHEKDKSVYIPPYYGYITPRSIGLYKYQYKNVSLLPFTTIAVLTIIQLKYFQYVISRRRHRMKVIKEEHATHESHNEQDQKKQEEPSLVDEIVDTIQEDPSNVKVEKQIIFSKKFDSFLLETFLVLKRFCVMHTPKLLIIFLFLAAHFNPNIIGLIYLVLVLVLAPAPVIASKIWFIISFYSGAIILVKYAYQHPFFTHGLCNNALGAIIQHQVTNFGKSSGICTWLDYIGLVDAATTPNQYVGNVLWSSLLVFIAALLQQVTFRWEKSLKRRGLYEEGHLFLEAEARLTSKKTEEEKKASALGSKRIFRKRTTIYINREDLDKLYAEEEEENSGENEENFKNTYKRKLLKFVTKVNRTIKYTFNHFYDGFGFEISLFTLLLGSLSLIQTLWGAVYLIVFGVCFFTGKKNKVLSRGWIFLVMVVEINMLILFFFRLKIVQSLQFYGTMMNIPVFSRYIILNLGGTSDINNTEYIVAILYLMMFFMALQARVFFKGMYARIQHIEISQPEKLPKRERGELVSKFLERTQKVDGNLIVQLDSSSLVRRNIDTRKIEKIKDFTTPENQKKLWYKIKLFIYRFFCFLVLIVMFIDAAIDSNVIKLVQMVLCLFYLNLFNRIYWKSVPFWRGIGIFYFISFVIDAIYQIPIVLLGDPINWSSDNDTTGWVNNLCLLFGLKRRGIENFVSEIIVVCLYYIQILLFESEDYIHFVNLLYRENHERASKYKLNQAHRAAQILSRFSEELFSEKRREANRSALKSFHEVNKASDFQTFYDRKHMLKDEYEKVVKTYAKNSEKIERERAILVLAISELLDMESQESAKIRKRIVSNVNKEGALMKKLLKRAEYKFQKKMREVVSTLENLQNFKQVKVVSKRSPINFERGLIDIPQDPTQEFMPSSITKEEIQHVMKSIVSKIAPHDRIVDLGDVFGAPTTNLDNLVKTHVKTDSINDVLSKQIRKLVEEENTTGHEGTSKDGVKEKEPKEQQVKYPFSFKLKKVMAMIFAHVGHYIYMFTDLFTNRVQIFIGISWMDNATIEKKYRVNLDAIIKEAIDEYIENKEKEQEKPPQEVELLDEIKLTTTDDNKQQETTTKEATQDQIPTINLDQVMQTELDQLKVHPDMKKKPFHWVPIALKIRQLLIALTKLFFNNTDVICFFAMLVNVLYAPTYFNLLFTFCAFTYAAIQYPYPHRYYYEAMLIWAQFLIAVQYILYLIQAALPDSMKTSDTDPAIFLLGWQPSTALLSDIVMYLLIILAIFFHREVSRNRGEWKTNSRKKKKSKEGASTDSTGHVVTTSSQQQQSGTVEPSTTIVGTEPASSEQKLSVVEPTTRARSDTTTSIELVSERQTDTKDTNKEPKKKNKTVKFIDVEEEEAKKEAAKKEPFVKRAFRKLVNGVKAVVNDQFKLGIDYYVVTVAVEIISFVLFFFSYSSMSGRAADETLGAIKSNELSGAFVIILFVFFIEICIERVLYLFASVTAKLIFHILLVIIYHIVYIVSYIIIHRNQNSTGIVLLKILFFIKCVYLFLASLQIRTGYPKRRYTQFFTRSYFWIAQYIYLGYRAIPFVFELKTLLDWTFIDTTFNFYEYLKFEDIYSALYKRKCDLEYKILQARGFGNRIFLTTKATSGFLLFVIFSMIIFFPLLFYSTANPALSYNSVNTVEVSIGLEGFESLYENRFYRLHPEDSLESFVDFFDGNGLRLFADYDPSFQIQNFTLASYSERYWLISTPSRISLVNALLNDTLSLNLTMHLNINRAGPSTQLSLQSRQVVALSKNKRLQLAKLINYNVSYTNFDTTITESISIPFTYNPYVMNKYSALAYATVTEERYLPNCTLTVSNKYITRENVTANNPPGFVSWFMSCSQPTKFYPPGKSGNLNSVKGGPFFFIQSTNIVAANSIISAISSFGIITFYTSFVLAVAQFIRLYSSGLIGRVIYEDLDNVDLLLNYCQDIYKAREDKDLAMEEAMYLNLLRIFRSTELLQVWTRDAKKNWL